MSFTNKRANSVRPGKMQKCCHYMEMRMLTVKFEDVLREILSGPHTYIDCTVILFSIIARTYE